MAMRIPWTAEVNGESKDGGGWYHDGFEQRPCRHGLRSEADLPWILEGVAHPRLVALHGGNAGLAQRLHRGELNLNPCRAARMRVDQSDVHPTVLFIHGCRGIQNRDSAKFGRIPPLRVQQERIDGLGAAVSILLNEAMKIGRSRVPGTVDTPTDTRIAQ